MFNKSVMNERMCAGWPEVTNSQGKSLLSLSPGATALPSYDSFLLAFAVTPPFPEGIGSPLDI